MNRKCTERLVPTVSVLALKSLRDKASNAISDVWSCVNLEIRYGSNVFFLSQYGGGHIITHDFPHIQAKCHIGNLYHQYALEC